VPAMVEVVLQAAPVLADGVEPVVLAEPSSATFDAGPYCRTTCRNSSALSSSGRGRPCGCCSCAVGDLRRVDAAVLRGDEHDAVGAARPVDRRRLRVLEDGDVGDVLRVDEVERVAARPRARRRWGAGCRRRRTAGRCCR
jgi:hypothetical protein